MNHLDVLMMLRRYRLLFLAVFIVTFLAGSYLLIPLVVKYEGSTTFYHTNENVVPPSGFSQKGAKIINLQDPNQERLYQMTFSTEVLVYLIQEFNLYKHYGVDSSRAYHFEKIINKLSRNIMFKRNTPDLFTIVVYDRDSEMAAKMANSLVLKLDELNRKYLVEKMQANLDFYESLIRESEKLSEHQNRMMSLYVEQLKNPSSKSANPDKIAIPKFELEYSLHQAAAGIEEVTAQLMIAKGLYSNAILTQKSNESPSLVIIRKAYPDSKSKMFQVFGFAALAGIVVCIVVFLIMYIFHLYPTELQIVFGRLPNP